MAKDFENILQYPDPVLKAKSVDVSLNHPDLKNLIRDLAKLAKENSKDGVTLVGLSAPQVGWNVNVFVYFDFNKKEYVPVINPKLSYSSKEITKEWEGCASVGSGKTSLFAPVPRSKSSKIEFVNLSGEEQVLSAHNYLSHVVLHEIDHLNGIIFLERVVDKELILNTEELDRYAKSHNGNYPKV